MVCIRLRPPSPDGHGGIWAAHRGEPAAGRDDHKVTAFADQFGTNRPRRNAIAKGPYGHMWFATDKGLLYTSMKDVHSVRTSTAIITGVKVSGRDMPPDRSIDLPPDIYRIQSTFSHQLGQPDGVRYRYKLEGTT